MPRETTRKKVIRESGEEGRQDLAVVEACAPSGAGVTGVNLDF